MTSSLPPEPPRQTPDPAKAEAEGAVLVRWRDSEGEAAAAKPTTGDLETRYPFKALSAQRVRCFGLRWAWLS